MKFLLFLVAAVTFFIAQPDETEGSLKITISDDPEETETVKIHNTNIRTEPALEKRIALRKGSLAQKIGWTPNKTFIWSPIQENIRQTVKNTLISNDLSVIVIIEKTAYGNTLIAVETETLKILKQFEINHNLRGTPFLNGNMLLFPTEKCIETINVINGKIGVPFIYEGQSVPKNVKKLIPDGIRILAIDSDNTIFSAEKKEKKVTSRAITLPKKAFAVNDIIITKNGTFFWSTENTVFSKNSKGAIEKYPLYNAKLIEAGTSVYAINTAENPGENPSLYRISGKYSTLIAKNAAAVCADFSNKFLYILRNTRGRVSKLTLETGNEIAWCNPNAIKPYTIGKTVKIFPCYAPDLFIAVSSEGTLMKIKCVNKRFTKIAYMPENKK